MEVSIKLTMILLYLYRLWNWLAQRFLRLMEFIIFTISIQESMISLSIIDREQESKQE